MMKVRFTKRLETRPGFLNKSRKKPIIEMITTACEILATIDSLIQMLLVESEKGPSDTGIHMNDARRIAAVTTSQSFFKFFPQRFQD